MKRRIDDVVSAANPVADGGLARLGLADFELDLRVAVAGEPRLRSMGSTPSRRRSRRPLLAVVALALLLGFVVLFETRDLGSPDPTVTYSEAAVAVAEANPRLLVGAPGWKVVDAGDFSVGEGEMEFSKDGHRLDLYWYPAYSYPGYVRDRRQVSPPLHWRLLGRSASTFDYGRGEYETLLAPRGQAFVAVRGRFRSLDAYRALIGTLHPVPVDTWLAAMPPRVVRPATRSAVVDRMLRGVPVPDGFDRSALQEGSVVTDHYALTVEVADEVSCAWVEQWLSAQASGDPEGAAAAVAGMSAVARSPLVERMDALQPGGWSENIRSAARELRSGRLNRGAAGSSVNPDGSGYEVGPAWAVKLQCEDRYWRRPLR